MQILKISYNLFKQVAENYQVFYLATADGYVLGAGHSEIVYTSNINNQINSSQVNDFIDNLLATSNEVELENDVIAAPTLNSTGNLHQYFDIKDDVIYIGESKPNVNINEIGWTIKRILLDNEGVPINIRLTEIGAAIWDNRTNEDYY